MKKIANFLFLTMSLAFCACGCSETNVEDSNDNHPQENLNEEHIDKEVLKYYENEKYIIGKRVLDMYHMSDPDFPEGETIYPELPNVAFVKELGVSAKIGDRKTIHYLNDQVYIADVNQDGHFDLCYSVPTQWRATYSSCEFDRTYVYDVYNDTYLNIFDSLYGYANDKKSYYFDLDSNNVLCIVEASTNMSVHDVIDFDRMARLLKNSKDTCFEWFDVDYKILDFGLWAVSDLDRMPPEIILQFFGFIKNDVEFPLKASQVSLEQISGGDYDVYIETYEHEKGRFDLWFEFYNEGDYKFKITVGNFSNTVTIHSYDYAFSTGTGLNTYSFDSANDYWTLWPQINFSYNSYLITESKNSLISYFGINDMANIEIKSEEDFNTFKGKISTLEGNGKITYKFDDMYPNVDFTMSYVVISAFYKEGYKVDCDVDAIYKAEYNFSQHIIGYYNENEEPCDSSCGVIITYLILPKNRRTYANDATIEYKKSSGSGSATFDKPIIYFYPEQEMDLDVQYINENNLITTYPKYDNGWSIHLNEDGTFTTNDSSREYYALYFDEHGNYTCNFDEGFYVTKENAISFLEEKMDFIGYTNREVDEFIMYWLPILEKNGQSLVYFEQTEQRNEECPLKLSTTPDTLIRTIIHIKKVDEKVNIPEQQLKRYDRSGFVVTEWGGVEY